jgi:Tol biopolymer transport system component
MRPATLGFLILGYAGCTPGRATDATASFGVRVWSGEDPDFVTGDVSPDGRYLTDINWDSGDLQVVDLETGNARDLTGQGYGGDGYAWMSAFSTDGRRVAIAWYVNRANSHDLRVVNLDGTGGRVLVPAGEGHYYIDPVDWSANDQEILVAVQLANRTWQLGLVSVADGAMRIVKTLGWQSPGGGHDQAYPDADLSPDGRYIAYDYPPDPKAPTRDILAIDLNGGSETTLVAGAGSDRLLGWLPDNSGILFYSDRSGTPSVWRQRVREGRPTGEPQLVHAGVAGLIPIGFTAKGYAYGLAAEAERVHIAVVDSALGAVQTLPEPVAGPVWRVSLAGDWSPDGTRLAHNTQNPFPDPVESLVIRSRAGEVEQSYPLTPALHTSNGTLRWVTEDRVLMFAYEQGRDGIFSVSLRDGTHERLATPPSIGRGALKWFEAGPEGRVLYLIRQPRDGGDSELLAFDVATGELRRLGTARGAMPTSLAVSPDGKELAYLVNDAATRTVELRALAGSGAGAARTLYQAPRGRMGAPIAWMPDGTRLVFKYRRGDDPPGLWTVGLRGGDPVPLLTNCCRENDVRISPDGRRLVFAGGGDRGELWISRSY